VFIASSTQPVVNPDALQQFPRGDNRLPERKWWLGVQAGPKIDSSLTWRRLALTFGVDAGVAQLAEQLFFKLVVCR
jgi:hypothetical protein